MKKYIKLFTDKKVDSKTSTKELNGGKGHNLIKMKSKGYPVPNGLVITTEACKVYKHCSSIEEQHKFIGGLVHEVMKNFKEITKGSKHKLVSVRSGAAVSMPGMMDTILNVGVGYNSTKNGSKKFKNDCKLRFVDMFLNVVVGLKADEYKSELKNNVNTYFGYIKTDFPTFEEMLGVCIKSVFNSWDSDRAAHYRAINNISDDLGTAIVIQSMVFGNLNKKSGSGVLFTRNPQTGENYSVGEWLAQSQGEDIVAGSVTPEPIETMSYWDEESYLALDDYAKKLEKQNKDMQDIEFTIEDGKLFILQTRSGKRSSQGEVQIALDMHKEGIISDLSILINKGTISKLKEPKLPLDFKMKVFAKGLGSGGFLATGKVALSVEEVLMSNENMILVAEETNPEDIQGMDKSVGILTRKGGITSHAAVVARGMNKPCVVGCIDINITELKGKYLLIDGRTGDIYKSNDPFTIDVVGEWPISLITELLTHINTKPYTVELDSLWEAKDFLDSIYNVSIESTCFEDDETLIPVLTWLSEEFDTTIIRVSKMEDTISQFVGVADISNSVINLIEDLLYKKDYNIFFDCKDVDERTFVVPEFEFMCQVLDKDFKGVVTKGFIDNVMGDNKTFDQISNQLNLEERIIKYISLASMLELELGIG